MRAINTGNTYKIYDDSMKVYNALPAQCYSVRFDKMTGFYLEKHSDIENKEAKVYGVHMEKVNKVLNTFEAFNRNLGVILSGDKGIGKSLFAKLLSIKSIEKGIPLIIVDTYIPGIASYIEDIEQEVVVLFDEFDKTFAKTNDGVDAQATMLSLFDGTAQGKKLFVVTCNDLHRLNDYLVNRPGRFHYHFRFEYPSPTDIKEYLEDKLKKECYKEIDKVIGFSRKVKLNYDCLRAIAFEINNESSFENAIKDLNIINTETQRYNIFLYYSDGSVLKQNKVALDMFGECDYVNVHHNDMYEELVTVEFNPMDCVYDPLTGTNAIHGDNLTLTYTTDNDQKEDVTKYSALKVEKMLVVRCDAKRLHYAV